MEQSSEFDRLLSEISSLRTAIALAPTCEVQTLPDLPPTIEPPPPIKKSEEIAFILDTSGSMSTGSVANGLSPQDVALPLLQNAFGALAQSQPMSLWRYDDCNTHPVKVVESEKTDISRELAGLNFDNASAAARAILNIPLNDPDWRRGVCRPADECHPDQ